MSAETQVYLPKGTICPIQPLSKIVQSKDGSAAMICFRKRKKKSAYVNCSGGCGSEHIIRAHWKDDVGIMALVDKAWEVHHRANEGTALDDFVEKAIEENEASISCTLQKQDEEKSTNTGVIPAVHIEAHTERKNPELVLHESLEAITKANNYIASRFNQLVSDRAKSKKESKDSLAPIKPQLWRTYNGDQKNALCPVCRNNVICQSSFVAGHIFPESKGGISDIQNLMPICEPCNSFMQATHLFHYAWKRHRRVLWSLKELELHGIQMYYIKNALLE